MITKLRMGLLLLSVLLGGQLLIAEDLHTETYTVPPDFFEQVAALPSLPKPSKKHREVMEQAGIDFPEGATVIYEPNTSRLIVRNTKAQMDLVRELVETVARREIRQVYVTIKEITFTDKAAEDSGFDWLLGPSKNPVASATAESVTEESRETFFDKLRRPPEETLPSKVQPDPALEGIAGVFTDPQFQVVMRALNQKKGIDLLSVPSVVCRSGQSGLVQVEKKRWGVVPTVGADGFTMDLDLYFPKHGKALFQKNERPKPSARITIWDGQTIAWAEKMGLGKNRVVFLTARLIDPSGKPVHPEKSEEE